MKYKILKKGINQKNMVNFPNVINSKKGKDPVVQVIEGISFVIVLLGVITCVYMNLVGRSLWWDEAALAYSFSERGLWNLTSEKFELIQSAPVGWLYLTKILTLIFGNTDFVLRIPSMLAYPTVLFLLYRIWKDVFGVKYPMAGTAFAASFPLFLQYSNMFKPYLFDGLCCLLAVWFYHKFQKGQWKDLQLGIGWAVLVWFSNPVCFVAGGLLLSRFVCSLKERRFQIKEFFPICIPLGGSFIAYYFYWLRQTATDDRMTGYWKDWNFPLFPTSLADLKQIVKLADTIFSQFYRLEYVVIILLAAFLIYAIKCESEIFTGIYLGFFVTVFASGLNMFPVNKRLWLFIYPMIMLVVFAGLAKLIQQQNKTTVRVMGTILLGVAVLNGGIRYYLQEENVYWPGYEVKAEVDYLKDIISPGENVYVFCAQWPIFAYYNHYNLTELEETGNQVLVGMDPVTEKYDCEKDLEYITSSDKCYVIMGDTWDKKSHSALLFPTLHEQGYFQMVYNQYETPLWYYCRNIEDSQAAVSYEISDMQDDGENIIYEVKIKNTGKAYLNPKFETLVWKSDEGDEISLPKNIAPGKTVTKKVTVPKGETVTYQLENEYGLIAENTGLVLGEDR